jgi:hypothetical protein
MTMKMKFQISDSVVIGSRKKDWYGKIGKIVTIYENGRCGVSYHGEPARAYKTTSLCHADKQYEALCEANPNWRDAIKNEMAQMSGQHMFVNPHKKDACRQQAPVHVETVDEDSSDESDDEHGTAADNDHGKKERRTPVPKGWTWTPTQTPVDNNSTKHMTIMTDDDGSIIRETSKETNMNVESMKSMEIHHTLDKQVKLLMDRVQKLAEENAILRMQNSKKNRIIEILLEDFKVMDISDAYFPDGRIKQSRGVMGRNPIRAL